MSTSIPEYEATPPTIVCLTSSSGLGGASRGKAWITGTSHNRGTVWASGCGITARIGHVASVQKKVGGASAAVADVASGIGEVRTKLAVAGVLEAPYQTFRTIGC